MFHLLSKLFRTSREIEAELMPTSACTYGGKGEIELELWSDGAGELQASLKHSGLPDGSEVDVFCGETHVTSLVVSQGYAKAVITKPAGPGEPPVSVGDVGSFRMGGETMYQGTFQRD